MRRCVTDTFGQLRQPHVVVPRAPILNVEHPVQLAGKIPGIEEHVAKPPRRNDLGTKQMVLIAEYTWSAQLKRYVIHCRAWLQPHRATELVGHLPGILRKQTPTIRVDRSQAWNDLWLDQKPAEQLLDACGVCHVTLKRRELAGHVHGGMMQTDQPLTWKRTPGEETGLEDRPFRARRSRRGQAARGNSHFSGSS
jgi:hypothetical protein